jgi:lycopene beta-cyclase
MALYFDYAFIGLGASNCLLIKHMHALGLFYGSSVAIIEPDDKNKNDRTFCFWAKPEELNTLLLKEEVSHSWNNIKVSNSLPQCIAPMQYHHIAGIDLYNSAKKCLENLNVSFYKESCTHKPNFNNNYAVITLGGINLHCNKVFDCRPPIYNSPKHHQAELKQSFYGLKVTTSTPVFDEDVVTLMDFNVDQDKGTQFIYILPHSSTQALVELTRFGADTILASNAHKVVVEYLQQLQTDFTIDDIEQAVIPMQTSELQQVDFNTQWMPIGKTAGMLKPSTGYAFHAMAEHAKIIADSIKIAQPIQRRGRRRFAFYDRLLLKILNDKPLNGKPIFETLFSKVPANKVLNFLKEKTSLIDEVKIFLTLPKMLFIKYAAKDVASRLGDKKIFLKPLIITCIFLLGAFINITPFVLPILILGFIGLGLPHGALDYLEDVKNKTTKGFSIFISSYILRATLVGVGWYFLPNVTLLFFILFSAWHFGQADFFAFKIKQSIIAFIWGSFVLLLLFVTHLTETIGILKIVNGSIISNGLQWLQNIPFFILLSPILIGTLFLTIIYKRPQFLLTFLYVASSYFVPILLAFGTYFIFQHSLHGWQFLKITHKQNSLQLFKKAMPFSIAAIFFIAGLYLYIDHLNNFIAFFFVFIACISLPHVLSMNKLYFIKK